ncbi:FAD-binding protein [Aquirufa ecclesiirivi]|uniref:FAD-binding and (Fe-S)-binding domain-containing protein n=1 Tax=Aquirufa ecclesiirivi TaxID=2715124 RepID=UPI0022A817A0|nr:FAD-binding and (Fe-S)-binding domain-containing protein [Aquirufa ecclesiirivi]MCZ2472249.1 FAD-binding protein [Aquirufa ecclesiirivi]
MAWSQREYHLLSAHFEGKLYFDTSQSSQIARKIYATDASVYQVQPKAVAIPASSKDIKRLIQFARNNKLGIIPRGAGTSLAGQVVGEGIVMEVSSSMSKIISLNKKEKTVWVEPGIVRDDLNSSIKKTSLFFGPETSTANRALLGGMVGNNSCGLHSIVWGNVRDHLIETKAILADGTDIYTHPLSNAEFYKKTTLQNLEGNIYRELHRILNNPALQELIRNKFPKPSIKRRNTGYALDALVEMQPFNPKGKPFNLSALIAGSEGTLAVVHSLRLQLLDIPSADVCLVCVHCHSIQESLQANLVALSCHPTASELVDDFILSFTEGHPQFQKDRDFIQGKPEAILMVEFRGDEASSSENKANQFIEKLNAQSIGYACPTLFGEEISKGWDIRKAGLGLIRNILGDKQAVNLIEDCAVDPEDLPNYVADIQNLLQKHQVQAAFYAHAGAGEIHIEPFLDLKAEEGKKLFRLLLQETVQILKKYQGSLSGEHGDGRLRGEFIPEIMGPEIYELFQEIKHIFDPNNTLNPGKIVHTPPMDEAFRIQTKIPQKRTYFFDYGALNDPLTLAEKCSGSGDCKKTALSGGTMCPSFMATQQEKDSTRARANMLRQILSSEVEKPFSDPQLKDILDLCLSCKGCQTECPSGVDISKLKAETLQQSYIEQGTPWSTQLIGHFPRIQNWVRKISPLYNFAIEFPLSSIIIKSFMGFSWERSIPKVSFTSLEEWFSTYKKKVNQKDMPLGMVYFFADEFTNYNDVLIGKKAIVLLNELGYGVEIPQGIISGRSYLSKGMLIEAKKLANRNVLLLKDIIHTNTPFIGLEPSAILSFRDEIPDLVDVELRNDAAKLKENCLLIDEFLAREIKAKRIQKSSFGTKSRKIVLHGHCHQKSIAGLSSTRQVLSFPEGHEVELIPSGCCGMAGSFGYEKKHFKISKQIANLVLFPTILSKPSSTIVASNGTSCRHQIKDGIDKHAYHTVEILHQSLANPQIKI